MRRLRLIALPLLAACASAPSPDDGSSRIPLRISGSDGTVVDLEILAGRAAETGTVAVDVDVAWDALPAVYDSVGVPVTALDAAARVLGSSNLRLRRELRGVPLHEYLDCGRTMGDYGADSYDIRAALLTRLSPAPAGGTVVSTLLDARARPSGVAGNWVQCASTGRLERRVLEVLRRRVSQ